MTVGRLAPTLGPMSFLHPSAIVEPGAELGEGVRVWCFCHVMAGARVGAGTSLGMGCFVAAGAVIGARCRVQNHVSVFAGVVLEDDVFVGPSAVFTNVKTPRAAVDRRAEYAHTTVRRHATVGANATVLPGVTVGCMGFVGAGAVVTADVLDGALVVGAPARRVGWVGEHGERLRFEDERANGGELIVGACGFCAATGRTYRLDMSGIVALGP